MVFYKTTPKKTKRNVLLGGRIFLPLGRRTSAPKLFPHIDRRRDETLRCSTTKNGAIRSSIAGEKNVSNRADYKTKARAGQPQATGRGASSTITDAAPSERKR